MKYLGIFLIVALMAVAGTQCTPRDPKAKIQSMEEKVRSESFTFDQNGIQLVDDLIAAYTDYAAANKNSDEAPEYLYRAAEFSLNLNKPLQAMEYYNQIIYQYPGFEKAPECLFLLAFIYENHMLNLGKAKELYETFIERYPDHDFADDAAISIQNMGKSPEELIREFEEKAQSSSRPITQSPNHPITQSPAPRLSCIRGIVSDRSNLISVQVMPVTARPTGV